MNRFVSIFITALNFQLFVLYPWHKELSINFNEIKQILNK